MRARTLESTRGTAGGLVLACAAIAMLLAACGSSATPAPSPSAGPVESAVAASGSTPPGSSQTPAPTAVNGTPGPTPPPPSAGSSTPAVTPTPAPGTPGASFAQSSFAWETAPPEGSPSPSGLPTPSPSLGPTATPGASPSVGPGPSPSGSPSATPGPASVDLTATVDSAWVVDTDWRAKGTTGTSRYQVTIANSDAAAVYPVCRISVVATNPNRRRTMTWAGSRQLAGNTSDTYEMEIGKTPVNLGAGGFGVINVSGITCLGLPTLPKNAATDAPPALTTSIVKSSASAPVGGRSTITMVVQVANSGTAPVNASCRAQVAGTDAAKPPIAPGNKVSVYGFDAPAPIAAGGTATLTFKADNAPVRLIGTRYFWLWAIRCWSH
jgi:hypothetical protein